MTKPKIVFLLVRWEMVCIPLNKIKLWTYLRALVQCTHLGIFHKEAHTNLR